MVWKPEDAGRGAPSWPRTAPTGRPKGPSITFSDEGFPVERAAIVAEDLRMVEQVTRRRGYGQAALQGAGSGAVVGALFGFFLGLFNLIDPLVSALLFALYGLIFGAILGLVSHAATGGQRDFSSLAGMEAGRYNVVADEEVAEEASRLLAGLETPSQGH